MGWLIRLGEWLKFRKCKINHWFIVSRIVNGEPWIIQATMKGVIESPLSTVAPKGWYVTMAPPAICDRVKLLEFCEAQLGIEYGVLTDTAIAIDILSWSWVPSFRGARKASWQCAALIAEGLRYGGWLHPWVSVYDIIPEDLFEVLGGDKTLLP